MVFPRLILGLVYSLLFHDMKWRRKKSMIHSIQHKFVSHASHLLNGFYLFFESARTVVKDTIIFHEGSGPLDCGEYTSKDFLLKGKENDINNNNCKLKVWNLFKLWFTNNLLLMLKRFFFMWYFHRHTWTDYCLK